MKFLSFRHTSRKFSNYQTIESTNFIDKNDPRKGHFLNGGNNKPKLEPRQFIYKLKEAMCQDFIMQLKSLDLAA